MNRTPIDKDMHLEGPEKMSPEQEISIAESFYKQVEEIKADFYQRMLGKPNEQLIHELVNEYATMKCHVLLVTGMMDAIAKKFMAPKEDVPK